MATRPTWTNVSAAGIDTPDLTKAGELFSSALKGLATTAQQFQTGREQTALSGLERSLRGAKTQEDIIAASDPFMTRLRDINAADANLTAAEDALRSRQLQVLGQNVQSEYDQAIAQSLPIIQEQYKTLTSDQQRAIAIDQAGNILISEPKEAVTTTVDGEEKVITPALTSEQIQETAQIFNQKLSDAGYVAGKSERDLLKDVKTRAQAFNATPEQIKTLQEQTLAFKQGKKDLTPEELQQVAQDEAKRDLDLQQALIRMEARKRAAENTTGYTTEEANEILSTNRIDLYSLVEKDFPATRWLQGSGGTQVKDWINENTQYKPSDIYLGIKALADTEADSADIPLKRLKDFLKSESLAKEKANLERASNIQGVFEQERDELTAASQAGKLRDLARRRGMAGIRDVKSNRAFMERYRRAEKMLQQATDTASASASSQDSDSSDATFTTGSQDTDSIKPIEVSDDVDLSKLTSLQISQYLQAAKEQGKNLTSQQENDIGLPPKKAKEVIIDLDIDIGDYPQLFDGITNSKRKENRLADFTAYVAQVEQRNPLGPVIAIVPPAQKKTPSGKTITLPAERKPFKTESEAQKFLANQYLLRVLNVSPKTQTELKNIAKNMEENPAQKPILERRLLDVIKDAFTANDAAMEAFQEDY